MPLTGSCFCLSFSSTISLISYPDLLFFGFVNKRSGNEINNKLILEQLNLVMKAK